MKKIISFDLDGTLVNAIFGDMVWNHGIPLEYSKKNNMSFGEAKNLIRKQYEAVGDADLLWYEIDRWLEKYQLSVTAGELLQRYESQIEPILYAQEVLEYLDQKYILVIASNAPRIFVDKELDYTGFRRYFTRIISATSDCKMVKKEERFYQWLCEALQVLPDEIIHVGDHPVFDHDVPSRVGIESYCLMSDLFHKDSSDLNGRRTIKSLKELMRLL